MPAGVTLWPRPVGFPGTVPSGAALFKVDIALSTDRTAPVKFATVPDPYRFVEDMLLQGGRIATGTVAVGESVEHSIDDPPGMPERPACMDTSYLVAVIDPGSAIARERRVQRPGNRRVLHHTVGSRRP